MVIYITALENTQAKLIVSESRTDDASIADAIVANLKARGLIVLRRTDAEVRFTVVS